MMQALRNTKMFVTVQCFTERKTDAGFTEHKKMFVIHCFTEHKNVCHEIGYRVLRNTKLLVKQGLRNTIIIIIIIMYIHHQPSESSHDT